MISIGGGFLLPSSQIAFSLGWGAGNKLIIAYVMIVISQYYHVDWHDAATIDDEESEGCNNL